MVEGTWDFGGKVSKTFVEHAKKSIMGYEEGHEIICKLSDFFAKKITQSLISVFQQVNY